MQFEQKILEKISQFYQEGKSVCATSSFQTQSLPLLHILSKSEHKIPILFIDTGYHFPETYAFVNQLKKQLSLNVVEIQSDVSKINQFNTEGNFLYHTHPDSCCNINKVIPLDKELLQYDVWITGVRKDQTSFRSQLQEFESVNEKLTKYHPMLDWNSKMVYEYIKENQLPKHPLDEKGYLSIGCMPCTSNIQEEMDRNGRWLGMNKKECGIHLK